MKMELHKCSFCSNLQDKNSLISIDSTVGQEVDLQAIVKEVFYFRLTNDTWICIECQTELLGSYKFKKKVEESLLLSPVLEIIKKVGSFVGSNCSEILIMTRNDDCLAIVPANEEMFMKFQGWKNTNDEFADQGFLHEIDIKEESFFDQQQAIQESYNAFEGLEDDESNSFGEYSEQKRQRKRSPEWLVQMIDKCKSFIHSKEGPVEVWNCVNCEKKTSTRTGMRVHLVKYHGEENARKPLKTAESTTLRVKSEAMELQSNQKSCESDMPMITHVESDESNGSLELDNSSSTSKKHKRDPGWIKEMIELSKKKSTGTWSCCICQKITSKTFRGIQLHIIRMHCEKREDDTEATYCESKLNFDSSEDEVSDDYESDYNQNKVESSVKHEKKLSWAKEMVDKSANSDNSSWSCVICNSVISKSHRGMLLHIVRKHKREVESSKSKKGRKSSGFNEAEIRKRLEKGKKRLMALDGDKEILVCSECDNRVFESEKNFKHHIINCHLKENYLQTNIKSDKRTDESILRNKMQRCEEGETYRCNECNQSFPSYQTIRYHLTTQHLSEELNEGTTPEITLKVSQMSSDEHMWFKQCMKKSRTEGGFQCCFCPTKVYTYDGPMRYHMMTVHLPHLKLGQDKLDKHLQQCKNKTNAIDKSLNTSGAPTNNDEIRGKFLKAAEMNESQKKWLKDNIKKSRVKTFDEDYWQCWMCQKRYTINGTIRYHLLVTHFPHFQLGETAFNNHVKDCKNQSKLDGVEAIDGEKSKSGPIWKLPVDVLTSLRCDLCDIQFCKKNDFKSHQNLHSMTEPVVPMMSFEKCDMCPMKFRCHDDMMEHIIHHSTHEESRVIPVEGIPIHASLPKNHIAVLTQPEPEIWNFSCGHCSKKYESNIDIDRHLLLHHMNPIKCPFDQREFTKLVPFINHLHSSHDESLGRTLNCAHCKIELTGNLEKIAHLKICDAKKYECDHCGKRFSSRMYLLYHIKKKLGMLDFSCEVCGKSYASRPELETHMRSHDPKKNYPCTSCDKSFSSASYRSAHMETHTNIVIQCEFCSASFNSRRRYIVHKNENHNEVFRKKKFSKHICLFCGKCFINKYRVDRHMQLTHGHGA